MDYTPSYRVNRIAEILNQQKMITSGFETLEQTAERIAQRLGIEINHQLLSEYTKGLHPYLLSYEKLELPRQDVPAIQKTLIGALSIIKNPCQFYDIFRACRPFFTVNLLDRALEIIVAKVGNFEGRLEKLKEVKNFDAFDSIFYELLVSAQYAQNEKITNVTFLDEKSESHPDIRFFFGKELGHVECKKFDRHSNFAVELRNLISEKTQHTLNTFLSAGQSAVIELEFHVDPHNIDPYQIEQISQKSFKTGKKECIEGLLSAKANRIEHQRLESYSLFPSAKHYWERYNYQNGSQWHGLVNNMRCKFGWIDPRIELRDRLASSWLDEISCECAIKWRITDETILWRYRKFAYNLLFKGLRQLQNFGDNSILHVWFERDMAIGHRKKELMDFAKRIYNSQKDIFSWIVFNETIFDVSIKGIFDLIEHAHFFPGPKPFSSKPLITNIFTAQDDATIDEGEFGIGQNLPYIDDIAEDLP